MRIAFIIALLFACPTYAADSPPKQAFDALNQCVKASDAATCRTLITASSAPLYDRFISYGLLHCLPKEVAYISEEPAGNYTIIRAATDKKTLRLSFVEEAGLWKLDIPNTLQAGIGANWQKQVNMTEQLYLLMRQQMGGQLDCGMVRGLAQK